ncbi:Pr6Pr family membrane protein [Bacillus sp. 03113]|uniref:Pr6Pr family membrane protein n=1 Tax=Bacillus sp. 03113 TaxID=2578211 RepID=UPI001143AAF9|nr:Pr6Pr family membrane protein [Bacillus sp. 03113]
MEKRSVIVGYRLFLSTLTFSAVITQFIMRSQTKPFNPVNFFSYFTIESNILAATILALSCFSTAKYGRFEQLGILRGAATVYIVTTGFIYFLLLRGLEESLQTPIPWVNVVLHYIMPIGALLDWVINPPIKRITWINTLSWLLFPLVYVVYSLVRGPFVDWYPYPFLDPRDGGYGMVAAYSLGITIAIGSICILVRMLGNTNGRMRKSNSVEY